MPTPNKLLAALPSNIGAELKPDLQHIQLTFKRVLQEPEQPISQIYFPLSGVVSMVNEPEPEEIVEIATVGREGFVGVSVLLGANRMPTRTLVQIAGEGLQMSTERFRATLESHAGFRELLMRYALALFTQVSQITSCNRLHEVQERCARWLLQTHDRVDGNRFELTQEFLAQMLGCHRPTVSIAASMLQRAGLIEYSRGTITILDRRGLEAASCPCYGFIAREYQRLLNPDVM
jgi:CRP-like cAMP-binding protein